ncbi:MAG: hypothetical protein ACFHHU_16560 [Porticoccaceae bacterium]|uniref:hypothetical protein n=1 Tax=Thalassospira sp. TaxID=1912094 RepID=UPI003A84EB3D
MAHQRSLRAASAYKHSKITGSNIDPRLKRQNPANGGVCLFGCGGRIYLRALRFAEPAQSDALLGLNNRFKSTYPTYQTLKKPAHLGELI